MEALKFRNGIAETMGVLVDCSNLDGPTISKKFKTKKIGSRATHEIEWEKDKVYDYESSDITEPEERSRQRLNIVGPSRFEQSTRTPIVSAIPFRNFNASIICSSDIISLPSST